MSNKLRTAPELALDEAVWLMGSFCALHHVAFNPSLFASRYPPPIDSAALGKAAEELDLVYEHSLHAGHCLVATWPGPCSSASRARASVSDRTATAFRSQHRSRCTFLLPFVFAIVGGRAEYSLFGFFLLPLIGIGGIGGLFGLFMVWTSGS